MYKNHRISLVLPCRNEERLIGKTLASVPDYIDTVYVVDDVSKDKTREKILERSEADPRIHLIRHEINQGPGGAIITGYRQAFKENADITVVAGGDHQMPLDQIPALLDPIIDDKTDYSKGNRFLVPHSVFDSMPKIRLLGNTLISAMTKIASGYYKIFDVVEGFTAINKKAYEMIDWSKAWKGYGYPMDFLIRLNTYGLRVMDVPRRAIYLEGERQSQIKPLSYALRVSPMLLKGFFHRLIQKYLFRDFHPVFFFYLIGLTTLPVGIAIGIRITYYKFFGGGATAPLSILCAILVLMGVQFLLFAMLFDMQESQ